jgi:RNA polymerase sigma-70 factor (ECF subfamily)
LDLSDLVAKAKNGDWQAFLKMALAKKDQLYYKALALLQNEHDAADAVEESLLKAYSSMAGLKEPLYFQAWLTRILVHTCIDMQRARMKQVRLETGMLEDEAPGPQESLAFKLDLQEQLAALGEKYRTVLVLRYYEEFKIEEIARLLDLPAGTVKSRIYYGLKKLHLNGWKETGSMNCEEIRFNLEPYLAGELFPAEQAAVEEHLDACCSCRLELTEIKEKIKQLGRSGIKSAANMPASLEKRLVKRLRHSAAAGKTGKRRNILRHVSAAAVALALVMVTFYSGSIAQFIEDMPFIRKYFSFGDKGVEHALKLGAGQHIEASRTVDGITVTIHRLIADRNETVILYSISAEAEADTAYISISVFDSRGRPVKPGDARGTHRFNEDLGIFTGQIRTRGIDSLGDQFQVHIDQVALQKTYTCEASFTASGRINQVIPLVDETGKTVGEYILESADIKGGYLHLVASYDLEVDERVSRVSPGDSDPGKQSFRYPEIIDVYRDETRLPLETAGFKLNAPDEYFYHMLGRDGGSDFRLVLAYEQLAAITGEPIIFDIEVDRELAANHTYEKELEQRVYLDPDEGIYIDFKRLESTAMATTIEYQVQPVHIVEGGGYWIPDIELSLYSDGARVEYQKITRVLNGGLFMISFDPAIPLETLSVSVDGYYRKISSPLEFAVSAADEGKTINAGGFPLTVEKIDFDTYVGVPGGDFDPYTGQEADGPFVMILYTSPVLAGLDDVTVTDRAGTREMYRTGNYLMDWRPPWQQRDEQRGHLIFSSDDTQWVIHAGSYCLFTETNITIRLLSPGGGSGP